MTSGPDNDTLQLILSRITDRVMDNLYGSVAMSDETWSQLRKTAEPYIRATAEDAWMAAAKDMRSLQDRVALAEHQEKILGVRLSKLMELLGAWRVQRASVLLDGTADDAEMALADFLAQLRETDKFLNDLEGK